MSADQDWALIRACVEREITNLRLSADHREVMARQEVIGASWQDELHNAKNRAHHLGEASALTAQADALQTALHRQEGAVGMGDVILCAMKLARHGMAGNVSHVANYARFLADKLEGCDEALHRHAITGLRTIANGEPQTVITTARPAEAMES